MAQTFEKDPDAVLDYTVDWSTWLGSDTISTSGWTVDSGLTTVTSANTTTTATVWVSGGTLDHTYSLTNTIVTAGNRTDERTIRIVVKNK